MFEFENLTVDINSRFYELLQCTICTDLMHPPIVKCINGHDICHNCSPRVSTCPTCRSPNMDFRNEELEEIHASLKFPCVNPKCCFICHWSEMKRHERTCKFKVRQCPFDGFCAFLWKGTMEEMANHIKEDHKGWIKQVRHSDYTCFPITIHHVTKRLAERKGKVIKTTSVLQIENELFKFVTFLWKLKNFVSFSWHVMLLDHSCPEKSKKFKFVLKFSRNHHKLYSTRLNTFLDPLSLSNENKMLTMRNFNWHNFNSLCDPTSDCLNIQILGKEL